MTDSAADASSIGRFGAYRAAKACHVSVGNIDLDLEQGDYTPADADEAFALATIADSGSGLIVQASPPQAPTEAPPAAAALPPAISPLYPEPRPAPVAAVASVVSPQVPDPEEG